MVACKHLGSWQKAASPVEVTIPAKSCLAAVPLGCKLSSAQLSSGALAGLMVCGHHCPSRIVLGNLGDMPKAMHTKMAPTSLASLFPQICPLLEHRKLVAWPLMLGLPHTVSVDNVTVNQAPGVGWEDTMGRLDSNRITETRVLLGREPLPHIAKLSRDSVFQSMIQTIMTTWDRGA